ncbi:MAG: class I SAM-dependent methyltransferase [Candidatus Adiutrix sp.]|jgi:SAM-dependent methyltransferase|nr:class I SAM-dependent methyltransferase [Candidatus Adiutrix sp.]
MFWHEKLGFTDFENGAQIETRAGRFTFNDGIWRQNGLYSPAQDQTGQSFAYKWHRRQSYDNPRFLETVGQWLRERYLDNDLDQLNSYFFDDALVLDAGCGAGMSASLLLGERLRRVRYLGVDISGAVDVAKSRFASDGLPGEFIQADLMKLPFSGPTFDVILSEGVLHHTDSVAGALKYLSGLLRPGGCFMFYVYRRKGPAREFTDDFIRDRLRPLDDSQAWEALRPLSRLGQALGDLDVEVEVPEAVDLLGIPAGRIPLQRLIYWYFCKMHYQPDWDLEELNHINFDWFRPLNCHRQSKEEVMQWCRDSALTIERFNEQESGFTVAARKAS